MMVVSPHRKSCHCERLISIVAGQTVFQTMSGGTLELIQHARPIQSMALIGNHLPRQCGIATFTTDLHTAITQGASPAIQTMVLAMNSPGQLLDYPDCVRFEIEEASISSYRRAAQFLNSSEAQVVSLQHEYGIFGGKAGSHILTLLRELRVPVVTTLHTILKTPSVIQKTVLNEVISLSDRLVVMSEQGAETLQQLHHVSPDRIDVIPHGIPTAAPGSRGKVALGLAHCPVIMTFGLLSPDKGIEYVLEAMPEILRKEPKTMFVILGATHPHVKEQQGESYRLSLMNLARSLGIERHVVFHDRFVDDRELAEFLSAADIYVTPYLNMEQSTSGTLARAVAAGRAVISTPYWHARELLADDRGILVPVRDAQAIAQAVDELLGNPEKRSAMGTKAANHGLSMAWSTVARDYLRSFEHALQEQRPRRPVATKRYLSPPADLPEVNLNHLQAMSDDTGMFQHARYDVPRYEDGYCLDDNARALLLVTMLEDSSELKPTTARSLGSRYLSFVDYAFDKNTKRFRNFMTYARQWNEEIGSEDSHARAIWALGTLHSRSTDTNRQKLGEELFLTALQKIVEFTSPRAWAYGLLGIHEFIVKTPIDNKVQAIRTTLVSRLAELFQKNKEPGWDWFEPYATYCNARLSQAMLVSGHDMGSEEVMQIGYRSLQWLVDIQRSEDGYFSPIGSEGFYSKNSVRALFDQQPVEAAGMVSACLEALRIGGNEEWGVQARRAFDWFLGQNHLQIPIYDAATGGCCDGLHRDGVNQNQGAESTLSFLTALVEMRGISAINTINGTKLTRNDV
jgi:glycosyltransferase involved in cell wall biosynthesis